MEIEVSAEHFSLDRTFEPSFISSLYERTGDGRWVKVAGHLGGQLKLEQIKPGKLGVKCSASMVERALERRVRLETGLWSPPFEAMLKDLPPTKRWILHALARQYPGIRLPIAPLDIKRIVIAVALSKRADYHRFVRIWCRRIWQQLGRDIDEFIHMSKKGLRKIGSSYQVLDAQRTFRSFLALSFHPERIPRQVLANVGAPSTPVEEYLLWLTPEQARITLIAGCWGLGPKTADSIVLSTMKAPHLTPCDVHLQTVTERLGLVDVEGMRMPNKFLCSRFTCTREASKATSLPLCPWAQSRTCLKSRLVYLGPVGGWLQTLAYLHGRYYCRTRVPRCTICPVRQVCSKPRHTFRSR